MGRPKGREEWRVIPGNENYEASNFGKIRNRFTGHILKQRKNSNCLYQVVSLFSYNKQQIKYVARLVWAAFNGCQCSQTIDHIDRNPLNNHLSNLRCVSMKENSANKEKQAKRNKYNLTTEIKVQFMYDYLVNNYTTWQIMKKYKLPYNYIHIVIKRGTWMKLLYGFDPIKGIPKEFREQEFQVDNSSNES